jgi:CheY-like chemotaxis protein
MHDPAFFREKAAQCRLIAQTTAVGERLKQDLLKFAAEFDAEAAKLEVKAALHETGDGMTRILLVEDDLDVRTLLEHVLVGQGYQVTAIETVQNARKQLETTPYDLVIADGVLPDGTGFEVADVARSRGVPALVITGHALQLPKDELLKYDYLLKPVRAPELLEAIRRRLPRPGGTGEVVPFPKSS